MSEFAFYCEGATSRLSGLHIAPRLQDKKRRVDLRTADLESHYELGKLRSPLFLIAQ
jgi:hypothetical protein